MNAHTKHVNAHEKFGDLKPSTVAGLVLIPLGAWAALEPFLFGGWSSEWHFGRFVLAVLPGVVAMVGGLTLLVGRRPATAVGGGLALAAGLWFIVGPALYAVAAGHELGTLSGGESVRLLQWMPFFFGAGALISLLSAYGLGLIAPLQFADEAWSEPVATPTRVRVPLPTERPRRQRGVPEPVGRGTRPQDRSNRSATRKT